MAERGCAPLGYIRGYSSDLLVVEIFSCDWSYVQSITSTCGVEISWFSQLQFSVLESTSWCKTGPEKGNRCFSAIILLALSTAFPVGCKYMISLSKIVDIRTHIIFSVHVRMCSFPDLFNQCHDTFLDCSYAGLKLLFKCVSTRYQRGWWDFTCKWFLDNRVSI